MHIHFEELNTTRSDCTIQTLSWMGKVPDGAPEEDGWKLNRQHYYQEGWLSAGNVKGIVSATFTTCHCRTAVEPPPRTNFNLRGHRNEVILVKWNEPYQKLATCDANGVIFVWIKHEGRWSVELINDRNSPVTDFAWSHDGRMALICYQDGFVLVGSVAGQRYWSTMLNLENATITCGIWAPNDQKQVLFGTTDGHIIVMSSTGAMVTHEAILEGAEISNMAFSCEKFNMDENENEEISTDSEKDLGIGHTLAVSFRHGVIYLMSGYDDICPRVVQTGLTGLKIEWTNDGDLLAVGGFIRMPNLECANTIKFYTAAGELRYSIRMPSQGKPLTALTWGHNDKRLFLATGCYVHVAWVHKTVASLQFLTQQAIKSCLKDEPAVQKTPLPAALRSSVGALFSTTIKGYLPNAFRLREFVSLPPPSNERLYCTMVRHGEETSGGYYTLYMEYLGGLIPLLKGKRASKLRPEFVIYDPKIKISNRRIIRERDQEHDIFNSTSSSSELDSDQEIVIDGCGSPRMRRKRRLRQCRNDRMQRNNFKTLDELLYDDNLPESHKLVEVTSNIWGTKFKLHGLASYLPIDLGHVIYKTSLLHLQPRQMTVTITELSRDMQRYSNQDISFSPHSFSEDDDESIQIESLENDNQRPCNLPATEIVAPIVPETCVTPSPVNGTTPNFLMGPTVPVIVESHAAFVEPESEKAEVELMALDMKRSSSSEYSIHSHRLLLTKSSSGASISIASSTDKNDTAVNGASCGVGVVTNSLEKVEMTTKEELNGDLSDSERTEIQIKDNKPKMTNSGSKTSLKSYGRSRSLEYIFDIDAKSCTSNSVESPKVSTVQTYLRVKRASLDSRSEAFREAHSSSVHPHPRYKGDAVRSSSVPTTPTKSLKKKLGRTDLLSKHKIQSPLLQRRLRHFRPVESSDDEAVCSESEIMTCHNYKDLEHFQKAQLRQKLRKARRGECERGFSTGLKQFVMHNKAPLWNENSQVYQLDFGGRVTQESAKNFQIEFRGKQVPNPAVMQFGRIDSNAYTLDFQYPFTAIQAFAVALANVTQRLK
ncbi:tubby-related protein 4-like [Lineus longissimus]|uniref:tubby-related protein 4-like n=1 Tax=Lineus longissimus TaxID=88925 RepID=UPI002B4F6FDC